MHSDTAKGVSFTAGELYTASCNGYRSNCESSQSSGTQSADHMHSIRTPGTMYWMNAQWHTECYNGRHVVTANFVTANCLKW